MTPKKQNNPPHWSPNQVNTAPIHSATWQKQLVSPELNRLLVSMEGLFFQDVTHQYIESLYMMTTWCSPLQTEQEERLPAQRGSRRPILGSKGASDHRKLSYRMEGV